MNGSLKIYWVICNYPHHVTLNHSLIQVIIYLKFPCMPVDLDNELCTTCNGWWDNVQPFFIHIFLLSSSSSVSTASSRQTSTGRLWLPLGLRVSTCLPLGLCLPALVPRRKLMHERDTGRQVSLLNSDEFSPAEGWEGKQRQAPERYTLRWDG